MKENILSTLRGFVVILVFLGILTLLFSVLTLDGALEVHHRLLNISLVFWELTVLLIIIYWIIGGVHRKRLSKEEKDAILSMLEQNHEYVSADYFVMRYGQHIYESLLRKGYLRYHFFKGKQQVYCQLTEEAKKLLKKQHDEKEDRQLL